MSIDRTNRNWIKDAVLYQIFPPSFKDSNGDGIGDLPGVIEKLDYIQELGATLIWLGPCFDSPFQDGGYDVRDFYQIAPRYGTNDDMRRLCREAHRRGLRVCLDLVAGHTSLECEWFKQSCRTQTNEYSDYYIWSDHWGRTADYGRWIRGYAPRDGNFMINFFYCQPKLNYGFANPAPDERSWEEPVDGEGPCKVVAELKNIMRFWLEAGCDGFRVDMAPSLVTNDSDCRVVADLWNDNLLPWLRQHYPHAVAIAEWGNPAVSIGQAGFDVDFMLHVGVPGYGEMMFKHQAVAGRRIDGNCFFDPENGGPPRVFLEEYQQAYQEIKEKGFISLPSANHDFQRLNYYRSKEEMKGVFTFLLTWPGVPSIFYGDEIGMRFLPWLESKEGGYTRTGSRTPMQWDRSVNAGFSTAAAENIYLPVDPENVRPNVEEQRNDPDSLWQHVRKLLALRRKTPELRNHGEFELLSDPEARILVYRRGDFQGQYYLIAVNPGAEDTSIRFDLTIAQAEEFLADGADLILNKSRVEIKFAALGWGIFKLRNR